MPFKEFSLFYTYFYYFNLDNFYYIEKLKRVKLKLFENKKEAPYLRYTTLQELALA